MDNIFSFIDYYGNLGILTIPLCPNSKKPLLPYWQRSSQKTIWSDLYIKDINIGIITGGKLNLSIIDCDDKNSQGTYTNFHNWLAGLGYQADDYPLVKTASGDGRHIYIKVSKPINGNYKKIRSCFGAGEFRYGPGAYVVAPPSVVNNCKYEILSGDFTRIPTLSPSDISDFVDLDSANDCYENGLKKVNKSYKFSRKTYRLLKGEITDRYQSRSEAEQAIITSLICHNYSFVEIESCFNSYPCAGKYRELFTMNPIAAKKWLIRSYRKAKDWVVRNNRTKKNIMNYHNYIQENVWTGRTGQKDKIVLVAHARIAFKVGNLEYSASSREIADLCGISHTSAIKATNRLCQNGFLVKTKESILEYSNRYRLMCKTFPPSHILSEDM